MDSQFFCTFNLGVVEHTHLRLQKRNFSAVSSGAHGEVQPDGAVAILFDEQLIKLLLAFIGIIK